MKKALFLLIPLLTLALLSFHIGDNREKVNPQKQNAIVQLRVQENDVLVGTYNTTTQVASITNISSFVGSTFKGPDSTEYTANQIFIDHTNGHKFYLNFTGNETDSTGGINVGIALYVGARDTPDVNYLKCPDETHSCTGNPCACCKLTKNANGCYNGCECDGLIKKDGVCWTGGGEEKCNHSVSASNGSIGTYWGDFIENTVTDPSL